MTFPKGTEQHILRRLCLHVHNGVRYEDYSDGFMSHQVFVTRDHLFEGWVCSTSDGAGNRICLPHRESLFGNDLRSCQGVAFEFQEMGSGTKAVNKYIGRFIPLNRGEDSSLEIVVQVKISGWFIIGFPMVLMSAILAWRDAHPFSAQGGDWLWLAAFLGWLGILLWNLGRAHGLRHHGTQILRSWLRTPQAEENIDGPIRTRELPKNTEYFGT